MLLPAAIPRSGAGKLKGNGSMPENLSNPTSYLEALRSGVFAAESG